MGSRPEDCFFKIICAQNKEFFIPKEYVSYFEYKKDIEIDLDTQVSYLKITSTFEQFEIFYKIARHVAFDTDKNINLNMQQLLDFCAVGLEVGYRCGNIEMIIDDISLLSNELYRKIVEKIMVPNIIYIGYGSIECINFIVQEYYQLSLEIQNLKKLDEWKDEEHKNISNCAVLKRFDKWKDDKIITPEYYNVLIRHFSTFVKYGGMPSIYSDNEIETINDVFERHRKESELRLQYLRDEQYLFF